MSQTRWSQDRHFSEQTLWEKLKTVPYHITHYNEYEYIDINRRSPEKTTSLGVAEWILLIVLAGPLVISVAVFALAIVIAAVACAILLLPMWPLLNVLKDQDQKQEVSDLKKGTAIFLAILGSPLAIAVIIPAVATLLALLVAAAATGLALAVAFSPLFPLLYVVYRDIRREKTPLLVRNLAGLLAAAPVVALLAAGVALLVAALGFAFSVLVVHAALAIALLAVSIPVVVVLHSIWGPAETKTPVRRSFFLNPSTWIMSSILVVGISLLIQGVDPLTFLSASGPLIIAQSVFACMATLLVLAGVAYGIYRAGLFISNQINSENDERLLENPEYLITEDYAKESTGSLEDQQSDNYITKYLNERWQWMKEHYVAASLIWVPGILGFATVLVLTIDFLTGGVIGGSLMQPVFDFMSQGVISGFQFLANLPGLEFLGSVSEATTLLIAQIISAITLISATLVVTDSASRLVETAEIELGGGESEGYSGFMSSNDLVNGYAASSQYNGQTSYTTKVLQEGDRNESSDEDSLQNLWMSNLKKWFES